MPLVKKMFQAVVNLLTYHDPVFNVRTRVAIADINAGYTLLPAIRGYKYRVVDMSMIAIGGAVLTATDVRILATQAAASAALLVTAIAGLAQNALNYPGLANNTILAGGASFIANDAETGITVGKTGANITGATHVDFMVSYVLERA